MIKEKHPQFPLEASVAIVLVGSNVTAMAAELVAREGSYDKVIGIARRGAVTSLPVLPESDELVDSIKLLKNFGARRKIRLFEKRVSEIVGGRAFDCFIHHSSAGFSQVLSAHPLCRKYYYLEEGITALVGGAFGRPKKRTVRALFWRIRSLVFFGGKIDKSRPFFDTHDKKYGGCCALSTAAFHNYPGRIQLPFKEFESTVPVPADVMVFVDSQYIIGNCTPEQYLEALTAGLENIVKQSSTVAIKFHPGEKDPKRKQRFLDAITGLNCVTSVFELPGDYIAERMKTGMDTKVIIGTTSIGYYLCERGFHVYTFAPRIAEVSQKYAKIMKEFPRQFLEVCLTA
jgi:hypothetical protein